MPDPVPTTDNHNLPKIPARDESYADEWGDILNDGQFKDGTDAGSDSLLGALEERVIVRDVQSEVTTYTPHADALFYATDTGRIYLGDGAAWNAQSFGTEANPVPGTSHFESVSVEQLLIGGERTPFATELITADTFSSEQIDLTANVSIGNQSNMTAIVVVSARVDNSGQINLTLDGNTSSNYEYVTIDTTLSQVGGGTAFTLADMADGSQIHGIWTLYNRRFRPAIVGQSGGLPSLTTLRHGRLNDNQSDLNTVEVSSTVNVDSATVKVFRGL